MSYMNGQIVHDLTKFCPTQVGSGDSSFAWDNLPENSTHYIYTNDIKKIAFPKTIKEAEILLQNGTIRPCIETPTDHCFSCRGWMTPGHERTEEERKTNSNGTCYNSLH